MAGFPWRAERTGLSGRGIISVMSLAIMMGVVIVGAWWTAKAVVSGDTTGTLVRFCFAAFAGWYYLFLSRITRRQLTNPADL